jgi:hypothetical protein
MSPAPLYHAHQRTTVCYVMCNRRRSDKRTRVLRVVRRVVRRRVGRADAQREQPAQHGGTCILLLS